MQMKEQIIECSTCYNGVLSRVYNRVKVNVLQDVPKENQMEHRIKCSAWNKVLAYIRVKLTDILLRFNITSSYIFRIFLQNQDNVMHGYSFYPETTLNFRS